MISHGFNQIGALAFFITQLPEVLCNRGTAAQLFCGGNLDFQVVKLKWDREYVCKEGGRFISLLLCQRSSKYDETPCMDDVDPS